MEPTILYFAQLAAGDGEDTFWIQLLVMVILGAGVGTFGVLKKHKKRYGSAGVFARHFLDGLGRRISGLELSERFRHLAAPLRQAGQAFSRSISFSQTKAARVSLAGTEQPHLIEIETAPREKGNQEQSPKESRSSARLRRGGERDFSSGMELLTDDFLVEVVEGTDSVEKHDITMRNLCFCELIRRNQLEAVSSDALKTYTVNTEGAFDKSIRYQAMRELAHRTSNAGPQSR